MCLLTPEQVSWSIWAVAGGCDQGMGGGCDQGVGGGCDQGMGGGCDQGMGGGCDQGMGGGCDQGVGGGCDQRMLKIGLGQSKKNYPYEFNGKELIVVNSVAYI